MFAWVLDAVLISPPAIAMPFDVFHPAGSPSVVMIAHGLLDSAIGYVIVDSPFVLKNNPHCLLTYSYKGYAGRVDCCCCVNIKVSIKASRVITVTAIAGNSY